ncbi:hypothetical protein GCM10009007_08980 [Formosimonas limnophila]|uniref:TIGR02646 family protein n=1 Tax=Formosimonas limnophila TaxID=1384487 RepID=A0A8J3FZP0_9BURK|nr:retron system putative HNH endonuclease [Formosimonas limnophila]GHA70438.1 hypothetical protein GCM10009007_08980 [Formosimonas limnophila]
MRYINKGPSPDYFETEKQSIVIDPSWNNLHCKTQLKVDLIAEQAGLCVYCEVGIDAENAHIEHIQAQSVHPDLRFEYRNLVASCYGAQQNSVLTVNPYASENIDSCGHHKDDSLDMGLFLNPVEVKNIGEYFVYDKTTCEILGSQLDVAKANYTISLLNLNNPRLNIARANARTALEKAVKSSVKEPIRRRQAVQKLLAKERPFISFLRDYFIFA